MNLNGEIIVVEDDVDDREFLDDIFKSLQIPNKVVFFEDSTEVVQYLLKDEVRPFLVLSDINMPKLDGYELRVQIMANEILLKKCVPYIFLSTSKEPEYIRKAFELAVHGYFQKEEDFGKYKEIISNIVSYWKSCQRPLIGW
ncbi:response regulator [Flavobacterium psychroterrae]|uniref:Response regulator n=1 Tax=Flavobacterium psychroterrae TaxID=2133767 RepID=A0ABS5PBQ9_9FLAO|nr:response regulator [Flavobacterium psychroterrae]MBS7231338.1 response regulator [Flavobacterium psychroterrae]